MTIEDFDTLGKQLRAEYFDYEVNSLQVLNPEAVLFWRRVAKIQKASGCSQQDFVQAQHKWFKEHETDPYSLEAIESLVTEWSLKRAKLANSPDAKREDAKLRAVPDEIADKARRSYEKWKNHWFPQDARTHSPKSDVWKRLVLTAEKSHEPLDTFIEAGFTYAVRKHLKVPTPHLLASAEGLRRSAEINMTVLDGPQKMS